MVHLQLLMPVAAAMVLVPMIDMNFVDAFSRHHLATSTTTTTTDARWRNRFPHNNDCWPLYGIAEWRENFSSISTEATTSASLQQQQQQQSSPSNTTTITANNSPDVTQSSTSSLPFLLLPFPPSQILLPGQSTTLQFKHGKYMDIIDDALTNYYGVIGCSILDEDGLLPIVVVCEIIEDSLEVKMGYRGFSSMEVSIRAVGRARRRMLPGFDLDCSASGGDGSSGRGDFSSSDEDSSYLYGRKQTAIEDIHQGLFEEWVDDDSILTEEKDWEAAEECVSNIERLLMKAVSSTAMQESVVGDEAGREAESPLEGMSHRRIQFEKSYQTLMQQHAEMNSHSTPNASDDSSSRQRRVRQAQLVAYSWASLAASDDGGSSALRRSSPSLILQALETRDTLERLRLGLAMLLDCQMMPSSDDNNYAREMTRLAGNNAVGGDYEEHSFQ